MEVAANVRLVRCPKCENLLPELPNFSLYKCGGCGAVLKAKKKGILEDEFSEISGDEKGVAISEGGSKINASDIHMETAQVNERNRVERTHNERVSLDSSFAPHGVTDSGLSRRGKERIREMEQFDDDYSQYSHEGLARNRNYGSNVDSSEYVNFHGERAFNDIRTPMESLRSRPVIDQWGMKSQGLFGNIVHHGEGPSSYDTNPYYEHGGGMRYTSHDFDGLARVENLENGRAELLRKLDELKDQLSRSCEMTDMPKQRVDIDQRIVSPDPYSRYHRDAYVQEGPRGVNKKQLAPDEMTALYLRQTSEFVPYTDRYGSGLRDPYCQRGYSHEYANAYHPEMHRRPPHQPQSQYTHRPYDGHFPSYYGNDNYDPFMLHQPACSCVHCYNKNWNLPPKVDPLGLYNGRSMHEPSNPNYHNHLNPLRPNSHNSRESIPLISSDLDSENDVHSHHRPRKAVVTRRNEQVWRPLAGGAPLVVCSNCFELLKLPRKHISYAKKEHKLKCGACSSIVSFEIGKNGFTASVSASVKQVEIDENVRSCSNDFDVSQPKISSPIDDKSNSSESEKHLDRSYSSSSLSEDVKIPEKLVTPTIHDSPPAELSITKDEPTPNPGLSPQGQDGNCSDNIVVARFDKGSESKRSELDTSRHDSVKDGAVASEMDVSLNEFPNSSVSRDSEEISKEDHQKVINKGGIFAAFIKNGFRDFGPSQVSVNGHLLPDRVVKKAEKLAGTIQPGDYWYDIQAGFWGVMGHPCLGIIMPNIEEFNYPMPEKCAAGNTGVFVNGRELHRKDFDLLVNRGLPNTRNGSYQVDISGKVVDEHTGEELDGLGKLAPTVEKEKHGFGMKVPRFIAESQR